MSSLRNRQLLTNRKKSKYSRVSEAVGLRFGYLFSSAALTFLRKTSSGGRALDACTGTAASGAVYLLFGVGPCTYQPLHPRLVACWGTATVVGARRTNFETPLACRPGNSLPFRSNSHSPAPAPLEAFDPSGRQTRAQDTDTLPPSAPESLWRAWLVDIALVRQKSATSKNSLFALTAVGRSGSNPDRAASVDPRSSNLFRTLTKLILPLRNPRPAPSGGGVIACQTHNLVSLGRLSST